MKRKFLIVAVLMAFTLLSSCQKDNSQPPQDVKESDVQVNNEASLPEVEDEVSDVYTHSASISIGSFYEEMHIIDYSFKKSEKCDSWYPDEKATEAEKDREITDDDLVKLTSFINELDNKLSPGSRGIFANGQCDPAFGSFKYNNGTMVKYVGENDTLEAIYDTMKGICSPVVTQKLMNESYMYSFDGEIYYHAAAGIYGAQELQSISKDDVISVDGNIAVIKLKRYYANSSEKNPFYHIYLYTVLFDDDSPYIWDYDIIASGYDAH